MVASHDSGSPGLLFSPRTTFCLHHNLPWINVASGHFLAGAAIVHAMMEGYNGRILRAITPTGPNTIKKKSPQSNFAGRNLVVRDRRLKLKLHSRGSRTYLNAPLFIVDESDHRC